MAVNCTYTPTDRKHTYTSIPGKHPYTPTTGKHTYASIPGKHTYTPTTGKHTYASTNGGHRYTPTAKADISMRIEELTNGRKVRKDQFFEWEGSAILDTFINVLGKNIEIQFDNGRILGSDFASAYIQMLQIASTQSMAWIQLSKDLSLKQRDLDMKDSLNESEIALKQRDLDMRDSLNKSEVALKQRDLDMKDSLNESEIALKQRDLDIRDSLNKSEVALKQRDLDMRDSLNGSEITLKQRDLDIRDSLNKSEVALKQRDLDMKDSANVTEFCIKNRKATMEEALAQRQIDGYDDNIGIKLLQHQFDAFSMIFSSGMVDLGDGDNALGPLNRANLTETYNSLATRFPSHPKYKK